jgi:glycosyltransferase involved in cell wall biosynthesis
VAELSSRSPIIAEPPVERESSPLKTTIAIICHNYGRFLEDCIRSVRALRHETHQVFVVDDASDDETPEVCARLGVPRHRVELRSVHRARQHAAHLAEQAGAEVIVFLDADDMLPPDYLAGLQHFGDPTVAIVYSDMQRFGLDDRLMEYPAQFDRSRFWIDNCVHAGSLCRISALRQADAFHPLTSINTHDDWTLWKRLIRYGYTAAKQPARYLYRQHPNSMIRKHKLLTYADRANLMQEPVTVFCPLSGRAELWDRYAAQLEVLDWPADQLSLILFDTSQSDTFAARVRRWMNRSRWSDIRHVRQPVGPPRVADVDRRHPGNRPAVEHVWTAMARIYNWLRRNLATEYAFILEDDVFVPTPNVIGRLMASVEHDVICVSGAYRSPYWGTWIAWDRGRAFDLRFTDKPSERIQQVGGTGFGCALMRRQMFDLGVFTDRADSFASVSSPDYDRARFTRLEQTHWRTLMDWSIECEHISRADVDDEPESISAAKARSDTEPADFHVRPALA